jgi:hypothetical protein
MLVIRKRLRMRNDLRPIGMMVNRETKAWGTISLLEEPSRCFSIAF